MKKLLRIVAVVLIISTVSLLVGCDFTIHNSPEEVACTFVKAIAKGDYEKMLKCCPEYVIRKLAQDAGLPQNASLDSVADYCKKMFHYLNLEGFKIISCELMDHMPAEDYAINRETYGMTGMEYRKVTEIAIVKVECEYQFSYNFDEYVESRTECEEFTCVKMGSKWYVLYDPTGY